MVWVGESDHWWVQYLPPSQVFTPMVGDRSVDSNFGVPKRLAMHEVGRLPALLSRADFQHQIERCGGRSTKPPETGFLHDSA